MLKKVYVKAKLKNGVVSVKALVKHRMITYDIAEKKFGDREKANFITHITATCNGKTVLDMSISQFLSKNPLFKFKFKGEICKKGDEILITWIDRKGNSGKGKGEIS